MIRVQNSLVFAIVLGLRLASADDMAVREFQKIFKARPTQHVKGEAIRTGPAYEVASGEIAYDAPAKEFMFEFNSKIRTHDVVFGLSARDGLVVRATLNEKKQEESYNFFTENKFLTSLLSNWAVQNWLAFVDIKNRVEDNNSVFDLTFKQGFYFKKLSLTLDPKQNITYAYAECGKNATYLFVSDAVSAPPSRTMASTIKNPRKN